MTMTPPWRRILFGVVALAGGVLGRLCGAQPWPPDDPQGAALVQAAQRVIAAYHDGAPKTGAMLRVVYFSPKDRDPLPGYAERLERVLKDVSDFYRDGLRRFGLPSDGLPLERKDGRLVLHHVRGKSPASAYSYESGDVTEAEIGAALKGKIDLAREYVLVIYALCRKEPDGRYVFDAPYYGRGSGRNGLCHAADCELLDPALLTETKKKIVYTEHYYPHVEQTLAEFNSWYLGGVAHELGHGLSLFHDAGGVDETPGGTSLMGSGNRFYRNEVWGGKAPAYLSRESALKLASHPLVTGSNRGRWEEINEGIAGETFAAEPGVLTIRGKVTGAIPAYAVVAYVWAQGTTDHHSKSFPVQADAGAFTVRISGLVPRAYFLRLASLHANGGTWWRDYRFEFDADGAPTAPQAFKWPWLVARAEKAVMSRAPNAKSLVSDAAIAAAPSQDEARRLRVLRGVVEPVAPADLAAVQESAAYLSDVRWTEAKVGWGKVARNFYWFDEKVQNGVFLMLAGKFHDKGLYAHSPSRYGFALEGKWKTFSAAVGLRDGALGVGSAVFTVRGDGKELFRSKVLKVGARAEVRVAVEGVKKLELIAEGGEGHTGNSWAIWVDPRVER